MATPSMAAMNPPPGVGDNAVSNPTPPTSPVAASPAPPKQSPQLNAGTQDLLQVTRILRGIAQSYPAAAPHVARCNNEIREIMRVLMQNQETPEPAAPPIGG